MYEDVCIVISIACIASDVFMAKRHSNRISLETDPRGFWLESTIRDDAKDIFVEYRIVYRQTKALDIVHNLISNLCLFGICLICLGPISL